LFAVKMGALCNRTVIVAEPQETLRDVALLMRDRHVGSVVIVEGSIGQRVPIGIITDRDIAVALGAEGREPSQTPVGLAMSSDLYRAREDQDVYDVLTQMRARGLRRVPVVAADGTLAGIFTFDDLVEWTAEHMLELSRLVHRELDRERHPSA
jgi:CBS domain-containing protein